MEKNDFNSLVLKRVPAISDLYEKEKREVWDGEGPASTIVVEDILMPFVYEALEKSDESTLHQFSSWLEEVLQTNDDYFLDVIYCGVFEKAYYEGKLPLLMPYFSDYVVEYLKQTPFSK